MRRLVLHSIAALSLLSASGIAASDASSVAGGSDPCEQFKMIIITPPKDIDFKMIIIPVPKDLDRAMVINPCQASNGAAVNIKPVEPDKKPDKLFTVPPFTIKKPR